MQLHLHTTSAKQGALLQLAQDMPAPLPSFLAMHHFDAPGAEDGRATNDMHLLACKGVRVNEQ